MITASPTAIWGTSGHARVVADIVMCGSKLVVAGFLDDVYPERHGTTLCGASVLGGREQLPLLRDRGIRHLIVAVGDCRARLRLGEDARGHGLTLATAIHPSAVVARDVTIGDGTVVAAGAVICPNARVGSAVIVNTAATIDHDCVVDDGCHVSPGAHLAGRVTVDKCTWIGIGATVSDGVHIGAGCIVGAGAVVVRDIPPGVVAYGNPARVRRRSGDG